MKKKIFKTIAVSLAVLALLCLLAGGSAWWFSCRRAVEVPELVCRLDKSDGTLPGGDISAAVELSLPWCCRIGEIRYELPPGLVAAGPAEISWHGLRFTERRVMLRQTLRPLRPGKTKEGKLLFEILRRGKEPLAVTAVIPSFEVTPGEEAQKLQLASAVEIPSNDFFGLGIAVIVIVIGGVLLALYLRRPKKGRALSEWELAVRELEGLKRRIGARELAPEQAFISITELMRRYLERRFGLPVTRRTAQEFINIMEQYGNRFPEGSRPFLKAFLAEADLVKFARVIPEEKMVERSVESAGEFIDRTRPESEVKNV